MSQVKQTSFEVESLIALKQKISNNPSFSWFAPFFDHIDQLKKAKYAITGIENFPRIYRKQLTKQFRNGVGIILKLFDNPEKEGDLLPKLEKVTDKLDNIVSAAEDKYDMNYSGQQLKIEFPTMNLQNVTRTK